jgi:hypothetical protein
MVVVDEGDVARAGMHLYTYKASHHFSSRPCGSHREKRLNQTKTKWLLNPVSGMSHFTTEDGIPAGVACVSSPTSAHGEADNATSADVINL